MFYGFRRRKDGLYTRPRYRCSIGKVRHYWSGPEQAPTHAHPAGTWCRNCDREQSAREGAPVAVGWDFEARLIADALIAVGAGASYREAAERMRLAAYRYQHDPGGINITSRAGETVARYLDYFAELVLAEVEHQTWPEILVLDAKPLRRREIDPDDPFSAEQEGNGAILFALGYSAPIERRRGRAHRASLAMLTSAVVGGYATRLSVELVLLLAYAARRPWRAPKRRPHLWKVAVAGGLDRFSWMDFLASLPGTPQWIVVDGDSAVRYAIEATFGRGAPIYSCEGHLKNRFRARARDQDHLPGALVWRLWPDWNPAAPEITRGPLFSPDDYRAFLDRVGAIPADKRKNITSWIAYHDATIRRQFEIREPGYPRGIGAIESAIEKVDGWIGKRRRTFQNVRRMNLVVSLMRAQIAGHADPAAYSKIIKEELERSGGRPKPNWRAHHNRAGVQGLFRLSDDATDRLGVERQLYWVAAQAGTVHRKAAVMNAYHAANGFPLLGFTKGKTPSVKVIRKKLTEFPLIAREWDPANPGVLAEITAGTDVEAAWICAANPEHRWIAPISRRTMRLSGCPECGRVRGVALEQVEKVIDLDEIRAAWAALETIELPELTEDDEIDLAVSGPPAPAEPVIASRSVLPDPDFDEADDLPF